MSALLEIESTRSYAASRGNSGSVVPATQPSVSASSGIVPTLVIGDIHGHVDRLEALLRQEGILDYCPVCTGVGEDPSWTGLPEYAPDCAACEGDGVKRTDKVAEVVLLGDLGHFGTTGSPTGDTLTWHFACKWADVILWGNHDRAMVDNGHAFSDFHRYPLDAFAYFDKARAAGKLKLAHSSHGYLFTHAGLALAFRDQDVPQEYKKDPVAFANWINMVEDPDAPTHPAQEAVRDAISTKRGGRSKVGGILWRDITEKLFDGFPQVFGHSADHKRHAVRACFVSGHTRKFMPRVGKNSYCIDVGGKGDRPGDNCLAGIWLPDERIVRVDL